MTRWAWTTEQERRFRTATELKARGDLAGAMSVLRSLIADGVESSAVYAVLGKIHWDRGDLPDATSCFQEAVRIAPRLEVVSLGLFHTLWDQGKETDALLELKRFLSVSHSQDYVEILEELRAKGHLE